MLADKLRAAAAVPAAGGGWTYQFQSYAEPLAAGTTLSQTMDFGVAAGNRIVVLMFSIGNVNTSSFISSVTIGGVSATKAGGAPLFGSLAHTEIWYATGVSGTSGNCVLTYGGGAGNSTQKQYLQTVALYGSLSSTNFSGGNTEAANTSPTISNSLSVQSNDFVLGIWRAAAVDAGSNTTWTGLTEQTDFVNTEMRAASTAYILPASSYTLNWSATSADTSVNYPRAVVARFRHT